MKMASQHAQYDVVVVGAGPNGLAAAITAARAGLSTLLVEAAERPGGGMRSAPLTLPGFMHDECSAVHPLGIASPFFRDLPLEAHGLTWVHPATPLAHVMDDGSSVTLERSITETAAQFGADGAAYRALFEPLVARFDELLPMILAPLRWPAAPFEMARFGLHAVRSLEGLARSRFRGKGPGALLSGISAHAMLPLDRLVTASFGLVLAMAGHRVGWPIARGGSQAIADALVAHFRALGGELQLAQRVTNIAQLPAARAYLLDVSARQLLTIAESRLSPSYARRVARFRYGPGTYKVDWALREPIPWRDARCRTAGTVHLSGDLEDVSRREAVVAAGELPERPFILLGQPSIADATRAPPGRHTAWAYCHVPHGSPVDALARIEREVERYAPGFADVVLARATRNARQIEEHGPNYVGGDVNCGLSDATQLFFRPIFKLDPYVTSDPRIYLCSSATPPGGGVHGMCGYWAARSALARVFGVHV